MNSSRMHYFLSDEFVNAFSLFYLILFHGTCSKKPPVGNGLDLSKTPMLSRPKNPPANIFLPSGSFLLTHLKLKSLSIIQNLILKRINIHYTWLQRAGKIWSWARLCLNVLPSKIQYQFLETARKELHVSITPRTCLSPYSQNCPCMYRWINISKSEFISWNLQIYELK